MLAAIDSINVDDLIWPMGDYGMEWTVRQEFFTGLGPKPGKFSDAGTRTPDTRIMIPLL